MGKLGGDELNYASDVDVLFVHDGDAERSRPRRARGARDDVDTRRPTASCSAPMPTSVPRAEPARCPARSTATRRGTSGGHGTGSSRRSSRRGPSPETPRSASSSSPLSRPYVWRDVLDADAIREVRTMKARAEAELERKGLTDRELKRGRGGIRDIEFAVQLLQLVHGRHDPKIRSAHDARRARAAGCRWIRRTARRRSPRRRVRVPAHRRAPAAALRRAADAHAPGRRARLTRLARVLGYRDQARAIGARRVRGRAPGPPGHRARDPRAAVLRTAARHAGRPRAAERGGGRGATGRVRLRRRRAHAGRAARAHRGLQPHAHACSSNCSP